MTAAAPPIAHDLKHGDYIRLRREAAGFSIDDVAASIFPADPARSAVLAELRLIEAGTVIAGDGDLARLARRFPLDPDVYRDLVDELPTRLCARCGASWIEPCGLAGADCAWAVSR